MSQTRLKGQEVEVLVVVNGAPKTNMTSVRSFEVTLNTEILSEGYLGETTEQKDSIFKGISGRMEMHFDNQEVIKVYQAIVDKARRRTPGTKINIKATLNFPNGQRPRVMLSDVEFGPMPLSFSSRSDYGTATLDFEGSDMQVMY